MVLENTQALYLSCDRVSSSTVVFSATFADTIGILDCFVLANSLIEAVTLIYSALCPKYDKSLIDSELLEVKFVKRLDVVSYE